MLSLAKQVTALLSCLVDLFAEYSTPTPSAQKDWAGLHGDGIPIALYDRHRYTCLHGTMLNFCILCRLFGAFPFLSCCLQV